MASRRLRLPLRPQTPPPRPAAAEPPRRPPAHHEALKATPGADPEDRDEYLGDNIFWVPQEARWSGPGGIQARAKSPEIGQALDEAMTSIERENPPLRGVLSKDYGRPTLDKRRLGELVDLVSTMGLGDAILKAIACELSVTVRRHASIDWSLRESARANLRRHVRRVLKTKGYPPDKADSATDTVLRQAVALGDQVVEELVAAPPPPPVLPFRVVPGEELQPFENAVPVLELAAAAGHFSGEQEVDGLQDAAAHPERFEWAELPDYYRPRPGMFVARVMGESMNRRIANGAWGLFRLNPQGTREGKAVLVQHREIQDTDLGGHFTLKVYRSEKAQTPDGGWEHRRVTLSPDTTAEGYAPIVIEADGDEGVRVIAELLGPVG